jgi:hypothetical protein
MPSPIISPVVSPLTNTAASPVGQTITKAVQPQTQSRSQPATQSLAQASEHTALTSFMAERNTIVLRRFDDVHVRLLLCLQDEIQQLEKELLELENPTTSGNASQRMMGKTRVLRELRKVVAEYGE